MKIDGRSWFVRPLVGVAMLIACWSGQPTAAQFADFEIEDFERAVTDQAIGLPLYVTDFFTLATEIDPDNALFPSGTAVSTDGNAGGAQTFNDLDVRIDLVPGPDPAVTSGDQGLKISMINSTENQGAGSTAFDRPAIINIPFGDPRFPFFNQVAANPANFIVEADVTLKASEIPDEYSLDGIEDGRFLRIGFYFKDTEAGWHDPPPVRDLLLFDNQTLLDLEDPAVNPDGVLTVNARFDATEIGYGVNEEAPGNSFDFGFVFNGNWLQGERAAFNVDNIRFTPKFSLANLDLDGSGSVDEADWGVLLANHLDPNADTFGEGDLDADGDNDFDDLRFFENGWELLGCPCPPTGAAEASTNVPEPTGLVLAGLAAAALALSRRRAMITIRIAGLVFAVVATLHAAPASAQLSDVVLYDWEDGLQSWVVAGDDTLGVTVDNSATGATQGSGQSLFIEQPIDGFNWGASNSIFGVAGVNGAAFATLSEAADVGFEHYVLEMDVTYAANSFTSIGSFANMSFRIQTAGGTSQVDNLAAYDFFELEETFSVSVPASSWESLPEKASDTGFYNFTIGVNGDWGFEAATIYYDNLRLRQVSAPALLTLEIDRSDGTARIVNDSGNDGTGPEGTGGPVDLNYYQILSPSGSLTPGGWSTLDSQGVDATGDGGLFDGWDAAGGIDTALSEAIFQSPDDPQSTQVADRQEFDLGTIFQPGGEEDLQFLFREPSRSTFLRAGIVRYVGEAAANADVNGDGNVDGTDLLTIQRGFDIAEGALREDGDANGDGAVNELDLNVWNGQFGASSGSLAAAASVPEPTTAALCALCLAACWASSARSRHSQRRTQ